MEQDRYQANTKLFIIGMVSLVLSLTLFALSFYVMPNLLFGWFYNTPAFINELVAWLQYQHNFSGPAAAKIVFFSLLILGCFFAIIADITSNRIDNKIFKEELKLNEELDRKSRTRDNDTMQLIIKILLIAFLVFIAAGLLQWLIYTPPESSDTDYAYFNGGKGVHIKVIE